MICICSFKNCPDDSRGLSVSLISPDDYHGDIEKRFATPSRMIAEYNVTGDRDVYFADYRHKVLAGIDPVKFYNTFDNKFILSWDPPGKISARWIIARWLEQSLGGGVQVPEFLPLELTVAGYRGDTAEPGNRPMFCGDFPVNMQINGDGTLVLVINDPCGNDHGTVHLDLMSLIKEGGGPENPAVDLGNGVGVVGMLRVFAEIRERYGYLLDPKNIYKRSRNDFHKQF